MQGISLEASQIHIEIYLPTCPFPENANYWCFLNLDVTNQLSCIHVVKVTHCSSFMKYMLQSFYIFQHFRGVELRKKLGREGRLGDPTFSTAPPWLLGFYTN